MVNKPVKPHLYHLLKGNNWLIINFKCMMWIWHNGFAIMLLLIVIFGKNKFIFTYFNFTIKAILQILRQWKIETTNSPRNIIVLLSKKCQELETEIKMLNLIYTFGFFFLFLFFLQGFPWKSIVVSIIIIIYRL